MGVSDLSVSFSGTWSIPPPVYQISIHLHTSFKIKKKLKEKKRTQNRSGTESKEVYGKSSLTYVYLDLFLDL